MQALKRNIIIAVLAIGKTLKKHLDKTVLFLFLVAVFRLVQGVIADGTVLNSGCVTSITLVDSTEAGADPSYIFYVHDFKPWDPCYDKIIGYIDSFGFDTAKTQIMKFYRYHEGLPNHDFRNRLSEFNNDIIALGGYDRERQNFFISFMNKGRMERAEHLAPDGSWEKDLFE